MKHSIQVSSRTLLGKKNRLLREQSLIPGVIYGHGESNHIVAVKRVAFEKLFQAAGESSLVDLNLDCCAAFKVLIHDIQRHPLSGQIIHIDFYKVKMTEKLTTDIPLVFVGESKAVKELGGILVKTLDHVKVECLPQDLVHELTVDLSSINTFDDAIHVSDLSLPSGLKVLTHGEEAIARVQPPRTEEEFKADLEGQIETGDKEAAVVGEEIEEKESVSKETGKETDDK